MCTCVCVPSFVEHVHIHFLTLDPPFLPFSGDGKLEQHHAYIQPNSRSGCRSKTCKCKSNLICKWCDAKHSVTVQSQTHVSFHNSFNDTLDLKVLHMTK
jgi:hypothetical protein